MWKFPLKKRDIAISVFIIIGAAFLYRETGSIPDPRFEPLGSAFFPRVILVGMMILALMQMVRVLLFPKKEDEKTGGEVKTQRRAAAGYIGLMLFLSFAYILSISLSIVNFYGVTFLFVFLLTGFLGFSKIRAWCFGGLLAAGLTSILYILAASLNVRLP